MWEKLKSALTKQLTWEHTPRYSRLAGDILCYEPLLQKRIIETQSEQKQWAIQSLAMLEQAKLNLQDKRIDEGWKCFHTAKRLEMYGMDAPERLASAKSICKESDKLNEWRKDAIISLLAYKNHDIAVAPDPGILVNAAELKDEHYNNQYYMNRLSHNLFWLLSGMLFLVLLAIVFYFVSYSALYGKELEQSLNLSEMIVGVLLFGLLGALTSAILFTRNLTKSSRIREISSSKVMAMSKIFIGAGFSIFIFLLLRSSIAGSLKIFSFTVSTPFDYFAIAFVSGFTERLAQKSMDIIAGKITVEKP
ncbi:MAG: hypothetical protein WCL21_13175 [Mariniphaga sp.]